MSLTLKTSVGKSFEWIYIIGYLYKFHHQEKFQTLLRLTPNM